MVINGPCGAAAVVQMSPAFSGYPVSQSHPALHRYYGQVKVKETLIKALSSSRSSVSLVDETIPCFVICGYSCVAWWRLASSRLEHISCFLGALFSWSRAGTGFLCRTA
jgi:hypothetical protein